MGENPVRVSSAAIRVDNGTTGVYKTHETGGVPFETDVYEGSNLPGRSDIYCSFNGGVLTTERLCPEILSGARPSGECGEVPTLAINKSKILGHIVNSQSMTLSLPDEKVQNIQSMCNRILKSPEIKAEELASILGKMSATSENVVQAPLFYRSLQLDLIQSVQKDPTYQSQIKLSTASMQELEWWIQSLHQCNGKKMFLPYPRLTISTDASTQGWGPIALWVRPAADGPQRKHLITSTI